MSARQTVNEDALAFLSISDGVINARLLLTNVIVTFLFGVVSILAFASVYLLWRQGIKPHSRKILLVATALLYASTAFYWVVNVAYMLSFNRHSMAAASDIYGTAFSTKSILMLRKVQQRATPTALTINMFVGDVVVWWRALAVWPGNKNVRCLCGIFLLVATLGLTFMSIVSTSIDDSVEPNGLDMVSAFFSGVFGALSALFSLLTNAAATGMIALQAWKHRRLLDKYLRQNHARSQVVKALIMLVESGAVYCTLWTIVVIYAFTSTFGRKDVQAAAPAWYNLSFYLTNGCLISFVAIYPMVIIVLVSLNKAKISRGQERVPGTTRSSASPRVLTTLPAFSLSLGSASNRSPC